MPRHPLGAIIALLPVVPVVLLAASSGAVSAPYPAEGAVTRLVADARDLGTLGGDWSTATDIDGDIVTGYSSTAEGWHAFSYDLGAVAPTMVDLGTLGSELSEATAVSGDIIVGASDIETGEEHAFAYDLGAVEPGMVDLGTPGLDSYARDVDDGVVVGRSETSAGDLHAFAYDLGAAEPRMLDLGTLGGDLSDAHAIDGDIVVGESRTATGEGHAFAYDLGAATPRMIDLGDLGLGYSTALDVSGQTVVGMAYDGTGEDQRAFVYHLDAAEPRMIDLGSLGGPSRAYAVAGDLVVGFSNTPAGQSHPFAYDADDPSPTMLDLGSLGGHSAAYAVDDGIVVGRSDTIVGPRAFAYDVGAANPEITDLGSDVASVAAIDGNVAVGAAAAPAMPERSHATAWSLSTSSAPALTFTHDTYEAEENASVATITVERVGDSYPAVGVHYRTVAPSSSFEGRAADESDYTPTHGELQFARGETRKSFDVPIQDDDEAENRESLGLLLFGPDGGVLGNPHIAELRIRASDQRPDVLIKARAEKRYRGDDIYLSTAGQTKVLAAQRNRTRHFDVQIQTDAVHPEQSAQDFHAEFVLRAPAPRPGSRVRYTLGDEDVTKAMRAQQGLPVFAYSYAPPVLGVHITVKPGAAVGSRLAATVTATWTGDRIFVDRVKAVVRVVR